MAAQPSVVHIPVRENGIVGTLIVPDAKGAYAGVLRLGGGEGGISVLDAETIASEGYAVFALAYFGMEELPLSLEEIALEILRESHFVDEEQPLCDSKTKPGMVGYRGGLRSHCSCRRFTTASMPWWPSLRAMWSGRAITSLGSLRRAVFIYPSREGLALCPVRVFPMRRQWPDRNAESAACVLMYEHSLNQRERVGIRRSFLLNEFTLRFCCSLRAVGLIRAILQVSDLMIKTLEAAKHPYEYRHIHSTTMPAAVAASTVLLRASWLCVAMVPLRKTCAGN